MWSWLAFGLALHGQGHHSLLDSCPFHIPLGLLAVIFPMSATKKYVVDPDSLTFDNVIGNLPTEVRRLLCKSEFAGSFLHLFGLVALAMARRGLQKDALHWGASFARLPELLERCWRPPGRLLVVAPSHVGCPSPIFSQNALFAPGCLPNSFSWFGLHDPRDEPHFCS